MSSKREVWEAAKLAGLDGFIEAVSRNFPGAIEGVSVSGRGIGVCSTDPNPATIPRGTVNAAAKIDAKTVKEMRKVPDSKRLK